MSGLRPGYTVVESTELTHRLAMYGGVLSVECSHSHGKYTNIEDATSLTRLYPSGSALEITLTPDGPLLDGSKGAVITQTVHMTNQWRDAYLRGIPFGVYRTTARLIEPNGTSHKLRLQQDHGATDAWEPSVLVEWVPAAWDSSHETMTQPSLHLGQ